MAATHAACVSVVPPAVHVAWPAPDAPHRRGAGQAQLPQIKCNQSDRSALFVVLAAHCRTGKAVTPTATPLVASSRASRLATCLLDGCPLHTVLFVGSPTTGCEGPNDALHAEYVQSSPAYHYLSEHRAAPRAGSSHCHKGRVPMRLTTSSVLAALQAINSDRLQILQNNPQPCSRCSSTKSNIAVPSKHWQATTIESASPAAHL